MTKLEYRLRKIKRLVGAIIGLTLIFTLHACSANGIESDNVSASEPFRVNCPFSIGDSVAVVQEFYNIDDEPEKLWAPKGPAFQYRLKEYGVWIFFDKDFRIEGLRFNKPYKGSVRGMRIGYPISESKRLNGEPDLSSSDRWTYNFGPNDYLTADFDANTRLIDVIFSSDCS